MTSTIATLAVGDILPELAVPLDRTTIVATAVASQDFEDVHHDPDRANERGTPDIFMSINATNGFLDRYVTDVLGPATRIRKVSLRLGVTNLPGDTMTFSGEVAEVGSAAVTLKVVGRNARGPHVTATVVLDRSEAERSAGESSAGGRSADEQSAPASSRTAATAGGDQ